MPLYNGKNGTVGAIQFNPTVTPFPKGVEEGEGITGEKIWTIFTPTGERDIRHGDFIIFDGEEGDFPDVVPYDVFLEEYTPIPDDVTGEEPPMEGVARPKGVRSSGRAGL
jgi:hypothetical protein